jgi:hypothetical protein
MYQETKFSLGGGARRLFKLLAVFPLGEDGGGAAGPPLRGLDGADDRDDTQAQVGDDPGNGRRLQIGHGAQYPPRVDAEQAFDANDHGRQPEHERQSHRPGADALAQSVELRDFALQCLGRAVVVERADQAQLQDAAAELGDGADVEQHGGQEELEFTKVSGTDVIALVSLIVGLVAYLPSVLVNGN